jgi:hypothetical protein
MKIFHKNSLRMMLMENRKYFTKFLENGVDGN